MKATTLKSCFFLVVTLVLTDANKLTVLHLTKQDVEATFEDESSGNGIHIDSAYGRLTISTLTGRTLVSAKTSDTSGYRYEVVTLLSDTYVRDKLMGDVPVTKEFAEYILGSEDAERTLIQRQLLASFNARKRSQDTMVTAIGELLRAPETSLMKAAVAALADYENRRITGVSYPAVLPFFAFVTRLLEVEKQINEQAKPVTVDNFKHKLLKRQSNVSDDDYNDDDDDDYDDCLDYCPPCEDDSCLGMCGFGCSCWSFLCGDCCYHVGCYDHRLCCRENFFSIACMFPIYFKCEENYYC